MAHPQPALQTQYRLTNLFKPALRVSYIQPAMSGLLFIPYGFQPLAEPSSYRSYPTCPSNAIPIDQLIQTRSAGFLHPAGNVRFAFYTGWFPTTDGAFISWLIPNLPFKRQGE